MGDKDGEQSATKDLLLADLEIFEDAIWRNEETGEKRFNFFVTLVTAVGAGLAALWTTEKILKDMPDLPREVTWQASLGLLIFGFLSFLRMMHRDGVTSEYKHTMRYIRRIYCDAFGATDPALRQYRVPLGKHFRRRQEKQEAQPTPLHKLGKRVAGHARRTLQGGYTVSLAFMNGILLAVTMLASGVDKPDGETYNLALSVTCGALLALVLCAIGSQPHDDSDWKEAADSAAMKEQGGQ